MSDSLSEVARACAELPRRPAVFDRGLRERVGKWWLQTPIPVADIVDGFRGREEFVLGPGRIRIPVHEPDSAEVTGEFLVVDSNGHPNVEFYDFSSRGIVSIPLEEFRYTYPAWRIRFWSPRTNPATVPSYLKSTDESGVDLEASATRGSITTPSTAASTPDERGDAFFERLRSFIEREREAARESRREAYASMTRNAFFDEFAGVRSVEPLGREISDYGEQIIQLGVLPTAEPTSDGASSDVSVDIPGEYSLYPGAEVFIDRVDDGEGFPVEAELFDVEGRELHVGVYWDSSSAKGEAESAFGEDSEAEFVVGELLNPITFDRESEAVSAIEADDRKRALVTGEASLSVAETSYSHVGADLNRSQQTAARNALRAEDVYCIHGPPGTGKTRTLTAIIREAVDQGLRVLACAHSNQAVDTLLVGSSLPNRPDPRSIHADAVAGDVVLARTGSNSANDIVAERYADGDVWRADVVGATMSAASDLADDMFDIAVIDEATQATIPSTLIPVAKADTFVLAGDHKQLPPYRSGERDTAEEVEFSLFEHLLAEYGADQVSTTLSTQYRMHEAIAAFPNTAFYGDVLTHGQENRSWTIGSLGPLVAFDVDGTEERTPMGSYFNRAEATVVAEEVKRLLEFGVMAGEIGVITPYTGQIGIVRGTLNERLGEARTDGVKIDTIDSFQGGEREAIVVSFVRSNGSGSIGFLNFPIEGPRRLNVALTRAQKRLVLVGDWGTLSAGGGDGPGASEYYRSLRNHLESVGAFENP